MITTFSAYNLWNLFFFQKSRQLVLFGSGESEAALYRILRKYEIDLDYFVDMRERPEGLCGKEVRSVYDLLYEEDADSRLILLAREDEKKFALLQGMGLTRYKHFRTIHETPYYVYPDWAYDPSMGHNILNREESFLPGFKIFGDRQQEGALKIVTLGGSTTCPFSYTIKTWSEFLWEELEERGYRTVVYCGGLASYQVQQELVKTMRDVIPLKPDLVIGLDGINNLRIDKEHPFLSPYQIETCRSFEGRSVNAESNMKDVSYGVSGEEISPYRFFKRYVKMIEAVLDTEGIPYRCFLQPLTIAGRKNPTEEERVRALIFCEDLLEECRLFYDEYLEDDDKLKCLVDVTDIYDGRPEVYFDGQHVVEEGNRIMAEFICRYIVERFPGGGVFGYYGPKGDRT